MSQELLSETVVAEQLKVPCSVYVRGLVVGTVEWFIFDLVAGTCQCEGT